jgi:transposase-like protein
MLHEIRMTDTRADAERAFDLFIATFKTKYPNTTECLSKNRIELPAFYDFPAVHWLHIPATNPVESTFASVHLRARKTKGARSKIVSTAMTFELKESASQKW